MSLQRVKQFKDLIVDHDTSVGNLVVDVWTDMPGGVMASRKSTTISASTGRVTREIPLDGIEGTLVKVKFTPSNTAVTRLYGATIRLRPVGVYMDGAVGDIWETQEIGFGVG